MGGKCTCWEQFGCRYVARRGGEWAGQGREMRLSSGQRLKDSYVAEEFCMIDVRVADITVLDVDAIVNAANTTLLGGGGVDGAIHRAAGPGLLAECRTLGGCPTGQARITGAYRLPARHVIHTPGPVWRGGGHGERELLAACYRSCLDLARKHGIDSVAFPAISCGAYGFPPEEACRIAVREVREFQARHNVPARVILACFSEEMRELFARSLEA